MSFTFNNSELHLQKFLTRRSDSWPKKRDPIMSPNKNNYSRVSRISPIYILSVFSGQYVTANKSCEERNILSQPWIKLPHTFFLNPPLVLLHFAYSCKAFFRNLHGQHWSWIRRPIRDFKQRNCLIYLNKCPTGQTQRNGKFSRKHPKDVKMNYAEWATGTN